MYRSRLQTEALHDLLEKLQKADFSPTAAFCVSTCCKLTEPEFTSLTSVNIRISSPDGPADRRSEHGGADECCRLHQRFKSSCKIQNWAEKTLHHQQQLVTVVCTLSTLIPIYNGLTTRWCYSGSAVSLTVCGSHVAPPNNQSGNVVNSFDPSWCWTHDHVFTASEETQYAENEQGLWNVEEKAGAAGGSDSRGEPKVSWNAADWRDCNHMDKKELEATCTKIRWGWCTNPSQKITCPRVRTANRV